MQCLTATKHAHWHGSLHVDLTAYQITNLSSGDTKKDILKKLGIFQWYWTSSQTDFAIVPRTDLPTFVFHRNTLESTNRDLYRLVQLCKQKPTYTASPYVFIPPHFSRPFYEFHAFWPKSRLLTPFSPFPQAHSIPLLCIVLILSRGNEKTIPKNLVAKQGS